MSKKLPTQCALNEIASKYREKYAKIILDYDAVKALMAEGASHGFDGVRIAQDEPLSLEATKPAKSLIKQLLKVGHKITWIDSATGMEGYAGDYKKASQYNELVIVWGNPNGSILHKVELQEED